MRFLRPAGKFIPRRSFASNSETSEIFRQFHQNFETLKRENGPESKLSGLIDFNIIDENKNQVTFILVHSQIKGRSDLFIWLISFAVNIWFSLDNIGNLLTLARY